jgi:hypothetical protein
MRARRGETLRGRARRLLFNLAPAPNRALYRGQNSSKEAFEQKSALGKILAAHHGGELFPINL